MTVNIMEKDFAPYPESMELKELGFDEKCLAYYKDNELYQEAGVCYVNADFEETLVWDEMLPNKNCTAPLYQQAFRWFRENNGLFIAPNVISYENGPYLWFFVINSTILPFGTDLGETDDFNTYEEAELACLRKLIEIVKLK